MILPLQPLLDPDDTGGAAPPDPPAPVSSPPNTPSESAPAAPDTALADRLAQLEQQLETDRAALRKERAELALDRAATTHNVPADLVRELVKPQFDEHGQPVGIDEAVKALIEKFPNLVVKAEPTTPPPPAHSPTNPARQSKTVTVEDQINAAWAKRGRHSL